MDCSPRAEILAENVEVLSNMDEEAIVMLVLSGGSLGVTVEFDPQVVGSAY